MSNTIPRAGVGLLTAIMLTGCTTVRSPQQQDPTPLPMVSPGSTPAQRATISPTPVPTPTPQPTPQPSAKVWTTQQLWENRSALVNQTLTVADIVSHESLCPDVVGVREEQCTTVVRLGEGGTGNHPFPVYQDGKQVQCQGRPDECNGWRTGATYQVIATLRQKQLNSGTALDSYYLDIVRR